MHAMEPMCDSMQVFEAEQSFLIHAFEDGDEVEVWSNGCG